MHNGRYTDPRQRRVLSQSNNEEEEEDEDTLGDLYSSFINDARTDPFCPHGRASDAADERDRLVNGRRPPTGLPSGIVPAEPVRFGTPFATSGSVVSRPMTAVRAVGFTSRKSLVGGGGSLTRLSSNSGGGSTSGSRMDLMAACGADESNIGGDVLGGAWSLTAECRLTKLEKTINELLNESYHANNRGDMQTALEKAKVIYENQTI